MRATAMEQAARPARMPAGRAGRGRWHGLPLVAAGLVLAFVLSGPAAALAGASGPEAAGPKAAGDGAAQARTQATAVTPRALRAVHPPMRLSPREMRLLAQMIEAEAAAEPYAGKVAVGAVILNRVRSPLFPDTVEEVIFEPWQFEPILNGWFWQEPGAASWRAARDAARGVDPTGGALYFWNPAKSGYQPHLESRPSAGWIGNHRFAY
ncbi:cell wall hydrolase SleB [Thermaerobacter marianensis DSM 12885]|uniref:Cell wall hydrolase SleB n=1 Tax=Thermaerobacter marianensis (strain ATCC 700841 / DSM 12885 / JCM 10246 / 7p75a) TaxID=644966 RepID=E6SGK1_THEM7|nr:cell wall hydrolase [Thermaerobacter marianensis]ADU50547.1 cell wall hydrolase SleB [Thermaerobacter marianensis DSM 12885]